MTELEAAEEISIFYGNPLSIVSDCLRGFLVAGKGKDLIAGDWSSIESRVVNWLSGEEHILDIFRAGKDIYLANYNLMFGLAIDAITKEQRQIGKVSELSLGFGGGKGAFQQMAKNYGVKVPDKKAEEIKVAFRASRPKLVAYWKALESAAISACLQPGTQVSAGPFERRVSFKKAGSFLWCKLPSGRVLCYPYPKIEPKATPWGSMTDSLTYMSLVNNQWVRAETYGGSLCENVTQAVSRDILVDGMFRLRNAGFEIVMHIHDEIVVEVDEGKRSVEEVEDIMSIVPAWAPGLPIAAEGWRGKRYKK